MNKQKITLPTKEWGTLKTKYQPESNDVTNDEFTAGSVNFITNSTGAIEKCPTDVQYNSTAFTNPPKDQFEAVFSNGVHHLLVMDGGSLKYTTGNRTISTAATGFTATASMEYSMYQNRVYMDNGIDNPSVYDITASYGGVTYTPPQVKAMGCQPPSSAVTFAADSAGGSVPAGGHTYKTTFLYYGSEESNGSSASALRTVAGPNFTVNLTAVPVGGYGVTARKIYRDDNDGNYLLVGTISNNTATTFADTTATGTTAIPTTHNLPPIFSYIALNLSRQFVAGVPGTPSVLYWSSADLPDIFDPSNFVICNPKDPINGLSTFQGITIVLNRHSFGKILGNTDDTFEYEEVSSSVGCVDNRSIQIRTIDGVPVLVWLSDRGFYKFDGSSVTYISDPIEDIVNFNLQQVSFTTGSNNQSTQADYAAGTSSPSIDITSDPGVLTVVNPKSVYQSEANWEAGLSLDNIATADGTNQLKVPTRFATTLAAGSVGGSALLSGSNLMLPTISDFTGGTTGTGSQVPSNQTLQRLAQSFSLTYAGTVTSGTVQIGLPLSSPLTVTYEIYSNVLGAPGVSLGRVGGNTAPFTQSLHLAAGTYWLVGSWTHVDTGRWSQASSPGTLPGSFGGNGMRFDGSNWGTAPFSIAAQFVFVQDAISSSGSWVSTTYDSMSIGSAVTDLATNTGSFPTSCSGTLFVDMSNDSTMSTGISTFSQANPNGSYSPSLSGKRYWRLRYSLSTTDNRRTPSLTVPLLTFNTTGTWISQPINCTTDVTSYDAITITQNVPAGTSVTVTVATSTDNITYSSFVAVGSAVVHRWVKVKVVVTSTSDNVSTASVSFLKFSWQQTSTFTSSIIDVGQIPTGWGVFQAAAAANGGTATFYMRSATSSGGIPAAVFSAVTNGVYPPAAVLPNEFTQWKVVFTSMADSLPEVSGVTVNWFIGTSQSPIRAASLFFNKTYYLSAATVGATTNNIVIVWDFKNNWRILTGVTINSLGLFFNEPFYCDGVRSNIYQWLVSPSGSGSAINMDVRGKAFDLGDVNTLKIPRSFRVTGINTGTTIHAYYSVDRGGSWIEMLNVNGTTGYVTSSSGTRFSQYFVPQVDDDSVISGTTVMFRVTSVDAYPCTIMEMEPVLYSRNGRYLEVET